MIHLPGDLLNGRDSVMGYARGNHSQMYCRSTVRWLRLWMSTSMVLPTQFGEYPDIDGDQAIWWVYNDKGNIHTESGGDAIGRDQAMAFAFSTNDEINDMTFYGYNVINFCHHRHWTLCFIFGYWVDSDLGFTTMTG